MDAILALEDGRVFRGRSFGAPGSCTGEMVFNTSMTGYQEILTDPSYRGQIVMMTTPLIGNCGVNDEDVESERPQVEGFCVREFSEIHSNWRSRKDLPQYLKENHVPAISGIDTRALTRHLRSKGAMKAALATGGGRVAEEVVQMAREAPSLGEQDLIGRVTCPTSYVWNEPRDSRWHPRQEAVPAGKAYSILAYDLGIKRNILRSLAGLGCRIRVVPSTFSAREVLEMKPDGVLLSNGPGDPQAASGVVRTATELLGKVPLFGICLGHQILSLALGGSTFKLKFGHRGGNHPVKELETGHVSITSQNHGFSVDPRSMPPGVELTHINLNDGTCEGFRHRDMPVIAVQYHPESAPGPHDSSDLFRRFLYLMERGAGSGVARAGE